MMKQCSKDTLFRVLRRDKFAALVLAFALLLSPLFHTLVSASAFSFADAYEICSGSNRTDNVPRIGHASECLDGRICGVANAAPQQNGTSTAVIFDQHLFITLVFDQSDYFFGPLCSEYLHPPAHAPPIQM